MPFNRLSQLILIAAVLTGLFILGSQVRDVGGNISVPAGLIYYGVTAVFCLVALWGMFLPQSAKTYIFISGVSAGVAVLGADVYIALTEKPDRSSRHEQYLKIWAERGIPHDKRSRLQVVEERRAKGQEIYPKLNPATLLKPGPRNKMISSVKSGGAEILPLGTVSRMTSVYCNETGQYLIYRSDRHGFHNPDSVWDRKSMSIAAVGDSFTEGACVPSDRNFIAHIRDRYPATLNLAMGGNGPLIELAALTEYLVPLRPRLVLWVYFAGNDLDDMSNNRQYGPLMRYLEDGYSQNLIKRQNDIDQALRSYFDRNIRTYHQKREARRVKLVDAALLRNVRHRLRERLLPRHTDPEIKKAGLDLFRSLIEKARSRVDGWGGKMVFVYLSGKSVIRDTQNRPAKLRLRRQILDIVAAMEIPVINVAVELEKLDDPLSLFISRQIGHFNEQGHKFVSDIILKKVNRMMADLYSSRRAPLPQSKHFSRP